MPHHSGLEHRDSVRALHVSAHTRVITNTLATVTAQTSADSGCTGTETLHVEEPTTAWYTDYVSVPNTVRSTETEVSSYPKPNLIPDRDDHADGL